VQHSEVLVSLNLKKVVAWVIVAFVVFYVIRAPDQSAQLVRNAGTPSATPPPPSRPSSGRCSSR
jgi:large-conductance mechanosensitive channel